MTLAPPQLDPSAFPKNAAAADVVFATFFVSPGINPDDYHSLRPDIRFARVLRQSHAHLKVHVAVLTDAATRLGGLGSEKEDEQEGQGESAPSGESSSVEIFRCQRIERSRMGRNSYCNYAQMIAQIDYLERYEEFFFRGREMSFFVPLLFGGSRLTAEPLSLSRMTTLSNKQPHFPLRRLGPRQDPPGRVPRH